MDILVHQSGHPVEEGWNLLDSYLFSLWDWHLPMWKQWAESVGKMRDLVFDISSQSAPGEGTKHYLESDRNAQAFADRRSRARFADVRLERVCEELKQCLEFDARALNGGGSTVWQVEAMLVRQTDDKKVRRVVAKAAARTREDAVLFAAYQALGLGLEGLKG
jgi:hypothetical protein